MAISAFARIRGEYEGAKVAAARGPDGDLGSLTAFIDQGSEFDGTLHIKDTIRIDGEFRGEITSENTVVVGETGGIEATIRARNVIISGGVVGDVVASRQLILHKTGRLHGNAETPSLQIEQGALFNGQVKMFRPQEVTRETPSVGDEASAQAGKRAPRWEKPAEPTTGWVRA